MNGRALRAGLIGLGAMGRHHAAALQDTHGVELAAVADPHGDRTLLPGVPLLPGVEELLAAGIDYAVVACPSALHEDVALRLAAAGVPALIEKPLATTAAGAARLADAFAAAGLPAAAGHVERFNPALAALREILATGDLGAALQVTTRREGPPSPRAAACGVLLDLAVHDLDAVAWLTGQDFDQLNTLTHPVYGGPTQARGAGEDHAVLAGRLTGGTLTSHTVNRHSPQRRRTTSVLAEHGLLSADTLRGRLTLQTGTSPRTVALPDTDTLRDEHTAFLTLLRTGRAGNLATLADGVRAVHLATGHPPRTPTPRTPPPAT
ncbi:Gfo/Idh/MocA family protein [Kitasatospora indigofera]|uniref:Gfo/Idh/MocA family protein n=1 Tax=Kitasatospora indigofera TaxID=67307 RepID=UPI0036BF8170